MHFDSCVVDCVLFIARRNYSPNITSRTVTGKISTIYDDFSVIVRLDNRLRVKYSFQVKTTTRIQSVRKSLISFLVNRFSDLHQRTKCHRELTYFIQQKWTFRLS